MNRIVKANNNKIVENPANLAKDFPNTVFPLEITQENLPENYFVLHETEKPSFGFDEKIEESDPVFENNIWKQSWTKTKLNDLELIQKQNECERKLNIAINQYMDSTVSGKGYDSIISACSYVSSSNEQYSKEARVCMDWREKVWNKVYPIYEELRKSKKDYPKFSDLVKELPTIDWP